MRAHLWCCPHFTSSRRIRDFQPPCVIISKPHLYLATWQIIFLRNGVTPIWLLSMPRIPSQSSSCANICGGKAIAIDSIIHVCPANRISSCVSITPASLSTAVSGMAMRAAGTIPRPSRTPTSGSARSVAIGNATPR